MLVVELGIKLDKSFRYYKKILKKHGLSIVFKCVTHDIYYTKENLDGLSEKEMKNKCIRLRRCNREKEFKVQNNLFNSEEKISKKHLKDFETELYNNGFKKMFDTTKKDFHFYKDGMHSRVQLQYVYGLGLIVYFDNEDYYDLSLDEQRKKLIDELNSYGFDFNYETLGLDKLRTLYYKKEMFSKNQNG